MASSSSSSSLPPDALFEIMSRADIKTLARCRLLSTYHRNLTYNSTFIRLHRRRTQTISGYFVKTRRRNGKDHSFDFISIDDDNPKLTLDFLPNPVSTILATSPQNGLLLCEANYDCWPWNNNMLLYVCKPATRQWILVLGPDGKCAGKSTFGLVVVESDRLRFKIVNVVETSSIFSESCWIQVYDSRKRVWSCVGRVFSGDEFPVSTPASAGGALHWLTSKNRVLSVDPVNEDFKITCLPRNLTEANSPDDLKLVESVGKLGVMRIDRRTDSVELWVRDGRRRKRWRKRKTVDMGGVREVHGGRCCAIGFCGTGMAVISNCNRLIFRDLRNGEDEIVTIGDDNSRPPESLFLLQSDFQIESSLMKSEPDESETPIFLC